MDSTFYATTLGFLAVAHCSYFVFLRSLLYIMCLKYDEPSTSITEIKRIWQKL